MAMTHEQASQLVEQIVLTDGWEDATVEPIDNYWYLVVANHEEGGVHHLRSFEDWKVERANCDLDQENGWPAHTCVVEDCTDWAEHECPGDGEEECTSVTCDDHADAAGRCPSHAQEGYEEDGKEEIS